MSAPSTKFLRLLFALLTVLPLTALAAPGSPPVVRVYPGSNKAQDKAAESLINTALLNRRQVVLANPAVDLNAIDAAVIVRTFKRRGDVWVQCEVYGRLGEVVFSTERRFRELRGKDGAAYEIADAVAAKVAAQQQPALAVATEEPEEPSSPAPEPVLVTQAIPDSVIRSDAPASGGACHGAATTNTSKTSVGTTVQYTRFIFPDGKGWYWTTAPQIDYSRWGWLSLQARVAANVLSIMGDSAVAGLGDSEVSAKALILGSPGRTLSVTAGVAGMLPTGSTSKRMGMGHFGAGPVVAASFPGGDFDLMAGVAGRFAFGGTTSHQGHDAAHPAPEDPMEPPADPHSGHTSGLTAPMGSDPSATSHLPFVGRHAASELGYSAGVLYGRKHTLGVTMNGSTALSSDERGQTVLTLRSEAAYRIAKGTALLVGAEFPVTSARRFEITTWSSFNWQF